MTEFAKKIRNIGRKVNDEALSGKVISEKLPEFTKTRKGTEIFIFENNKKVRVYDDCSMYPEASASKWRVQIYNIENGFFYDRACMKNGLFPTKERAIAEIERFKDRAGSLIFYLLPVNFSYNKEKLIWPEEEQKIFDYENPVYAAEEEQLEEAEKRMYYLTGRMNSDVKDIMKKVSDVKSYNALLSFKKAQSEKEVKDYPFLIIDNMYKSRTILYVGADKSYWESERCGIRCDGTGGYISAYVYNTDCPEYSEYGDIGYIYTKGKLLRTA